MKIIKQIFNWLIKEMFVIAVFAAIFYIALSLFQIHSETHNTLSLVQDINNHCLEECPN